ncbi:E3 ubiquitin ligase PQT3-like isoform X3 [Amaranthus tricolor]|uniref:E3 ubiquitin ligase PQT3-like isoform X3 n=1 Tax=Amaranthus tricolor TaxID=29722 RepID=UPI002585430A|nr:E3 ubiquitin ligase PQT3-like isoform X3 [Amaranthus tricolor]
MTCDLKFNLPLPLSKTLFSSFSFSLFNCCVLSIVAVPPRSTVVVGVHRSKAFRACFSGHNSDPEMTSLLNLVSIDKDDEDEKIKKLVETSSLIFCNSHTRHDLGRGFGRSRKTPPVSYVCRRCNIPGHYIKHCPTNGDPNYDIKKVILPTGIPKSMLLSTKDGPYTLPTGSAVVVKPNEDVFDKEMEGISSSGSNRNLPPELHCPLCKKVMQDAVISSKCCFESFCDKCIRDHIISKSMCVCGERNVLADNLLPNKTLRDTIKRFLESGTSSSDNGGSTVHQARPRITSSTQSVASLKLPSLTEQTSNVSHAPQKQNVAPQPQAQPLLAAEGKIREVQDVTEVKHGSVTMKKPVEEELQQTVTNVKTGKKNMPLHTNEMQWMDLQHGMNGHMGLPLFNPYWPRMQLATDSFTRPFGGYMPYNMGYGLGPSDMPFGHYITPDCYLGAQGFMIPPHQSSDSPMNYYDYGSETRSNACVPPEKSQLVRRLYYHFCSLWLCNFNFTTTFICLFATPTLQQNTSFYIYLIVIFVWNLVNWVALVIFSSATVDSF